MRALLSLAVSAIIWGLLELYFHFTLGAWLARLLAMVLGRL
jgi:hypothetical protein